jgi:transposase
MVMYYVGIDIGKRIHEATAIDEKGNIASKPIRFANDRLGFEKFLSFVAALSSEKQNVQFALESTGHYWLVLYHFLTQAGFTVLVLNPLQTEGQRRSHIRKTKTDTKDSLLIAKLLRLGDIHVSYVPSTEILHLRELVRFRFGLSDTLADLKRKVISVLDKVFPEYEKLFSDVFIKTSKAILNNTADTLSLFAIE